MHIAEPVVRLWLGERSIELSRIASSALIGRDDATCALVTTALDVSRRHAEVFLDGNEPHLRDLGSSNGTWVDDRAIGAEWVALRPGQRVYVGHQPLRVEWLGAGQATVVAPVPAALLARMEARQVAFASPTATPHLGEGGVASPPPAELSYRRQGKNSNGELLLALPGDTFHNGSVIAGFVEFTALDDETISSILVELVEYSKETGASGTTWDRALVRQGPWRSRRGDVVPAHFELRVPSGTSMSGRGVAWEVRGLVDIDWAFDVATACPITMRNVDVERLRDELGALDYRLGELESDQRGQHYRLTFEPAEARKREFGVEKLRLDVEYLGLNLKVLLTADKVGAFNFDKRSELIFGLEPFRNAPSGDLGRRLEAEINSLIGR